MDIATKELTSMQPQAAAVKPNEDGTMRNTTFSELKIGDFAVMERTISNEDIQLFALASGDLNPAHLDAEYAAKTPFKTVIAHGMWGASMISALLGTQFPGPGTIYLSQTLRFSAPVRVGDTLTVKLTVKSLDAEKKWATLECVCTNQKGKVVISGDAEVIPPAEHIEWTPHDIPEVRLIPRQDGPRRLIEHARSLGEIKVAVVHPCDAVSLESTLEARKLGLINPILVAPRSKLEAVAAENNLSLDGVEIEDVPHSHAAAETAVQLVKAGKVEAVMKGSLHTDELMSAIVAKDSGLRTKRRISHCFLMETAAYPRPFIVTDAAINIAPDLGAKADIIQNAIDLAHVIGVDEPKVAILAAVETINAGMQATLDAAALCKMSDRGQITGAVLDGPLAFDNAVSPEAARIKGIKSPVAGQADILMVPDLESGNMLFKALDHLAGAHSAGVVLGAKMPIILTSRADSEESRIASCALAVLLAHHYRVSPP